MRNANGYGSVYKLSGKRRRPYIARITVGWSPDGKQLCQTIGYYATKKEAQIALAEYNKNPYDVGTRKATFGEIYERWAAEAYAAVAERTEQGYRHTYKNCLSVFAKRPIADIKFNEFEMAINNRYPNYGSRHLAKTLLKQIYSYAQKYDIVSDNKIQYINIGKKEKSDLHYRFSDNEVAVLWQNAEDIDIQIILIYIYTGVRPQELFDVRMKDIDIEHRFFRIRSGKTENASRIVPIHEAIVPFVQGVLDRGRLCASSTSATWYQFARVLDRLNILKYENDNGDIKEHKPHDCRHTFASMWADAGLNEMYRRKIQGHSGSGIGEVVYTHESFRKLLAEVNKLPTQFG